MYLALFLLMEKRLFFYFLFLFFSACGSLKNNVKEDSIKRLSKRKIIKALKKNPLNASTFELLGKVVYKSATENRKINLNIHIQKDKKIGITASFLGFTIAKALITKKMVHYYFTINKTYFEGGYDIFKKLLGIPIGFEQLQNLLLGETLFDIKDFKTKYQITNNQHNITSNKKRGLFFSVFVDDKDFKINKQKWMLLEEDTYFQIVYSNRQTIQQNNIPLYIQTKFFEKKQDKTTLEISYKNVKLNQPFHFLYRIPKDYQKKQMNL